MDDLISRAAAMEVIDAVKDITLIQSDKVLCGKIYSQIKDLPSVYAVPVVHGRWIRYSEIFHDPEYTLVKCSVCGGVSCCDANYCPDCGAKMDGKRRDENATD